MASAAALRQLRTDPVVAELIAAAGDYEVESRLSRRPSDPYGALLRSIIGQQLSTTAAHAIYGRVIDFFDGHIPTPAQLFAADPDALRGAGLSRAKVVYLRDLAERVSDGRLAIDRLADLPDETVAAELIAVNGIGQWTVDMFLLFHLRRPDILPVGDLGIRSAVKTAYALPELPLPAELVRIAEPWRPHRSLASLYLWHSLDNEPVP